MLKKLRIAAATVFFVGITLLFLDFTGTLHAWLGWMTHVQFIPALLAGHVVIVAILAIITLIAGRLYCSIICPLGVMQDCFGALGRRRHKNRYSYSRPLSWLRWTMLALMTISMIVGVGAVVALLEPYSTFGRIATNLLQPVWMWGNNLLARWAESVESYTFYSVDVWVKSGLSIALSAITLAVIGVLAWRNGRTWCNTVCPVGTLLGFLSRFSLLRPVIDTDKCINCGKCARNCKASCIDAKNHSIDYSRCVTCFDCIGECHTGAISYRRPTKKTAPSTDGVAQGRRSFMTVAAVAAGAGLVEAKLKVDGGLAVIQDKKIPERKNCIVPPGAVNMRHLDRHCTACQLCVAACPNGVLRPSTSLDRLLKPEASYERGYCRPECTRCGDVCPAGAIKHITREEKTSISVGRAVVVRENCIPLVNGHSCGNCERHCPSGAIIMVPSVPGDENSVKIPTVNESRCIGCGACENLCPARPVSAIYVEGRDKHNSI